jgi:Leu/Phe-tRNA-protein transferase
MHGAPVDWVKIDPAYTLVLENKHINNYMKTTVDEKWKIRLHLGFAQLLESLLSSIAW